MAVRSSILEELRAICSLHMEVDSDTGVEREALALLLMDLEAVLVICLDKAVLFRKKETEYSLVALGQAWLAMDSISIYNKLTLRSKKY